jgi:hypothetical protein
MSLPVYDKPQVTEDSSLTELMMDKYQYDIGRTQGGGFCVGGALCDYFKNGMGWYTKGTVQDIETNWVDENAVSRFPFVEELTDRLCDILKKFGWSSKFSQEEIDQACYYYASVIIEENDSGNYQGAWSIVEDFLMEFQIDDAEYDADGNFVRTINEWC